MSLDPLDPLERGLPPIEVAPAQGVALAAVLAGATVAFAYFLSGGNRFVTSSNVLENAERRAIFAYIQAHPGVHLRGLAGAMRLTTTNALWHLRKLETASLVSSRRFEGYRVFYPSEGGSRSRQDALAHAALRNPNARALVECVAANPGIHQRALARALGLNAGTIRWHLRKLQATGLVLRTQRDRSSHYYASELVSRVLGGIGSGHESVRTPWPGRNSEGEEGGGAGGKA